MVGRRELCVREHVRNDVIPYNLHPSASSVVGLFAGFVYVVVLVARRLSSGSGSSPHARRSCVLRHPECVTHISTRMCRARSVLACVQSILVFNPMTASVNSGSCDQSTPLFSTLSRIALPRISSSHFSRMSALRSDANSLR